MCFFNYEQFNMFLSSIYYLGEGSQGICYVDIDNQVVYKVFHSFFENERNNYTKSDILRFSNINNDTFIWASDVIMVGDEVVGYISPYKKAKNLYEVNPLHVDLDSLETAIERVNFDLKVITNNDVAIYDLIYNVLYSSGHIYAIDTLEYAHKKVDYKVNKDLFDMVLKLFLVDNYFNYFVDDYKVLKEMYELSSCEEFLKEFRKKLGEYMNTEIVTLNDARKLVRKIKYPRYIRYIK